MKEGKTCRRGKRGGWGGLVDRGRESGKVIERIVKERGRE